MDGWLDGWVGGRTGGWVDGWVTPAAFLHVALTNLIA